MFALVVVAAGLAGCTQSSETGPASLTIWWAQWAPADGLQQLAADFTAETKIPVKVHQIPWSNYQDQAFLEFGNTETAFDILIGDSQWMGRGATRGLYLDLTDWLPKAVDLKTIHPRALRYLCEYPPGSSRYFAAPCETDSVGFIYRRDWFEDPQEQKAFKAKYKRDLKTPDTWEELRDIAAFFQRPEQNRYGCAILTGRSYDEATGGFQIFMWSFGGSWGDPSTYTVKGFLNSEGSVKGLEFMQSLVALGPKGASRLNHGDLVDQFMNGTTAMVMEYFAFFPGIVEKFGDKAGVFLVPREGDRRVTSLGGQGFSISTKISAERQERAKQFIAWCLRTETQLKWSRKPAGFTANTEILKSEAFRKATSYNAAFADSLDSMQDFWNVPVYNELLAASQKHLGAVLEGQVGARQALDQLAVEHEQVLRAAGLKK
jgi:multiple sugar transport system substrate-binding protein